MNATLVKVQRRFIDIVAVLALGLPIVTAADVTTEPLVALGLTNVPIGEAALEIIEGGVLFVHNTDAGAGVSVQLGEADSGIFLYPLTGDLYGGDTMEARAYGRVNATNDQFISSVRGIHNGDSSGTVTVDFSSLGASSVSVFVGDVLLGQMNVSNIAVRVASDGYGCRANPWWRMPNGRFGAVIELQSQNSISLSAEGSEASTEGNCIFLSPDDVTNSVAFVSRVDVTSLGIGSFCLTDARLGVFHQRHKALGAATLFPSGGQLHVGNLVSNMDDGMFVELASVSTFDVNLLPLELPGTNATLLVSAYGTAGGTRGMPLGSARLDSSNGFVRLTMQTSISDEFRIEVRSNGVVAGSVAFTNAAAVIDLSGRSHITGYSLFAKTMEMLPGMAVRVDGPATFTMSSGEMFVGDEVRMSAADPVSFESVESLVMVANGIPSFTITGEQDSTMPPPQLDIARTPNGVALSWPDPNRIYFVEAAATLTDGFVALEAGPDFDNNYCRQTLSIGGNQYQFFRLRRHVPSND